MLRTTAELFCCLLDYSIKIWPINIEKSYEETKLCSILSSVIPQCHELYLVVMPTPPHRRQ